MCTNLSVSLRAQVKLKSGKSIWKVQGASQFSKSVVKHKSVSQVNLWGSSQFGK
jgi:hypothetical protein